jgi:hypothetical protein
VGSWEVDKILSGPGNKENPDMGSSCQRASDFMILGLLTFSAPQVLTSLSKISGVKYSILGFYLVEEFRLLSWVWKPRVISYMLSACTPSRSRRSRTSTVPDSSAATWPSAITPSCSSLRAPAAAMPLTTTCNVENAGGKMVMIGVLLGRRATLSRGPLVTVRQTEYMKQWL